MLLALMAAAATANAPFAPFHMEQPVLGSARGGGGGGGGGGDGSVNDSGWYESSMHSAHPQRCGAVLHILFVLSHPAFYLAASLRCAAARVVLPN